MHTILANIRTHGAKVLSVWGVPTIVFLVSVASFGLGRLSTLESTEIHVSLQQAGVIQAVAPMNMGGLIVGSRSGSTYHFPWCAGAQQISEQNKRWFKSEDAARKAGYAPAKNCKGLE